MIFLYFLVFTSLLTIGVVIYNIEDIFKDEEIIIQYETDEPQTGSEIYNELLNKQLSKKDYYNETASSCDCCNIINLDNNKYYVEIIDGKDNTLVVRLCFKNKNIFLSSERYVNKSHAIRKSKELAISLKCELRDSRKA